MTEEPPVSVIILNRDRLIEVGRTLKALNFQTYRNFEVIVVSNQTKALFKRYACARRSKLVDFQTANISAARNAGLEKTAGEIVAFCDDDAVPEPNWLGYLISEFSNNDVGAVGGRVRGRNGISLQWGDLEVDEFGNDWPLTELKNGGAHLSPTTSKRSLKTQGTNCAFRKSALASINGFDEAYRFFLDETDANWRLTNSGWRVALSQHAEVHHHHARSAYRNAERVPKSLTEIGARKAYFCKRFGDPTKIPEELDGFRNNQKQRLIRAMELGLLDPFQVEKLAQTLEDGFMQGYQREPILTWEPSDIQDFKSFPDRLLAPAQILTSTPLNFISQRRKSAELAAQNIPVTLLEFMGLFRMLTVRFSDKGYWLHKGGIMGRSYRNGPIIRTQTRTKRIAQEIERIRKQRLENL